MSDYNSNVVISMDAVAKCWKVTEYGALFLLLILRLSNPVSKIALALHVGLHVMLALTYAPVVYYKMGSVDTRDSQSTGLLQKITGFIPNLMYKVSRGLLQIGLHVFRLGGKANFNLDVKRLGASVTFLFIIIRKLLTLCVAVYITSGDDESTHIKALAGYTLFVLIQMKFINSNTTLKTKAKLETASSFVYGLKKLVKLSYSTKNDKSACMDAGLLQLIRDRIFRVSCVCTAIFLYYTYTHISDSLETDLLWMGIFKSLVLLDALFTSSFLVELLGLQLYFVNTHNTIV